jgi:hypothetical protein
MRIKKISFSSYFLGILLLTIFACSGKSNQKQIPIDSLLNRLNKTPDSLVSIVSIDRIDRFYHIKKGELISDSISIRNVNNNDAVIEQINSSCECTAVDFKNKSVIKSMDSLAIKFHLKSDGLNYGFNHRTINLLGNFYPFYKNVHITIFVE